MEIFSKPVYTMSEIGCLKDGMFQNLQVEGPTVAGNTVFARGYVATKPSLVVKWPAHTADVAAEAHLVTVAEILTGVMNSDPDGSARAWTLPTAALLRDGVVGCQIGDCIDFTVINTGTAAANEIITVSAGSNGTLVGLGAILTPNPTNAAFSSGSGLFRIRFTAVVGAAGSYTVYRLA